MFLFIWVNYLNVSLNGTSMVQHIAKMYSSGQRVIAKKPKISPAAKKVTP